MMLELILGANVLALVGVLVMLYQINSQMLALRARVDASIGVVKGLSGAVRRLWERQRAALRRQTQGATE